MIEVAFAVGGALVMFAWQELTHRYAEKRTHRELCNHQWGPLEELRRSHPGQRRFFYKKCLACREQMNCNEDGSKYVPPMDRPHDDA